MWHLYTWLPCSEVVWTNCACCAFENHKWDGLAPMATGCAGSPAARKIVSGSGQAGYKAEGFSKQRVFSMNHSGYKTEGFSRQRVLYQWITVRKRVFPAPLRCRAFLVMSTGSRLAARAERRSRGGSPAIAGAIRLVCTGLTLAGEFLWERWPNDQHWEAQLDSKKVEVKPGPGPTGPNLNSTWSTSC